MDDKIEKQNMDLGLLIRQSRKKSGITQAELYNGLCTKEVYLRIEKGLGVPDELLAELLLSRLHMQYRLLDMMVNEEEFRNKELRYEINQLIGQKKYVDARERLKEYCARVNRKHVLQEQYIMWKEAQLLENVDVKSAGEKYRRALECTMMVPEMEKRLNNSMVVSSEEYQMYIGYRHCLTCFDMEEERNMLIKMENSIIAGHLYPPFYYELGQHYVEMLFEQGDYLQCKKWCERLLYQLKDGVKVFYTLEIYFVHVKAAMRLMSTKEEREESFQECRMLYYTALAMGKENEANFIKEYCRSEFEWHIIA